jgi:choline dehydrogenase-like flavoprotein
MSKNSLPICIVGSGLSGISAAKALLSHGVKIIMIDPGLDLSPNTAEKVNVIGSKPAWQWGKRERQFLQKGVESSIKGVKEKRLFGSNFASRELTCFPVQKRHSAFYMSFAKAGLGNIWGAGLLPMHADDMSAWPISYAQLYPHYKRVLEFMPLAGRKDRLERIFPIETSPHHHRLSRQTENMFARMEKYAHKLENEGFFFGASRLAGRYHGATNGFDCQYCGMCLYGCPYGIPYSGRDTLAEMSGDPNFHYRSGLVATGFKPTGKSVDVYVTDTEGRQVQPVHAQRVLLACGPFATARIVLDSLGLHDVAVYAKTTDQYYLPFFSASAPSDIGDEQLHTMCQAFWVLRNKKISPFLVHSSIYTYNDLYTRAVQALLGRLYRPLRRIAEIPLGRLYFTITYLHSHHSAKLKVTLKSNTLKTLEVEGKPNPQSIDVFERVRRHWMRMAKYTGLLPAPFYSGNRLPGSGNHSGGLFPMTQNPQRLQTDTLGCFPGLDNVHLVDSSVFPSITATTITYSIMANAHRIADTLVKDGLVHV